MPYQVSQTWSFTFFIIYSTGYEFITVMWASHPTPLFGYSHGSHNTIVPVGTPCWQVSVVLHLGHSRIRSRVPFLSSSFHDSWLYEPYPAGRKLATQSWLDFLVSSSQGLSIYSVWAVKRIGGSQHWRWRLWRLPDQQLRSVKPGTRNFAYLPWLLGVSLLSHAKYLPSDSFFNSCFLIDL